MIPKTFFFVFFLCCLWSWAHARSTESHSVLGIRVGAVYKIQGRYNKCLTSNWTLTNLCDKVKRGRVHPGHDCCDSRDSHIPSEISIDILLGTRVEKPV